MAISVDLTNNNKNCTFTGTINAKGLRGECRRFNGTSDFGDIGNQGSTIKTIEFLFNPDLIDLRSDYLIDLNGTDYVKIINGTLSVTGFSGSTVVYYINGSVGSTLSVAGIWYHIVITSFLGFPAFDLDLMRVEGVGFGMGLLDEVRFYTDQKSASWVVNNWNQYSKLVIINETFDYGADGVTKTIPNWNRVSGTWKIGEITAQDSFLKHLNRGNKYIENVTAGLIGIKQNSAYGTCEFDLYKGGATNVVDVWFTAPSITTASQYGFRFESDESVSLREDSSALLASAASYIKINKWYRIRVTRTTTGVFTVYIKGDVYGNNWVLISVVGGSGTNPITDTTYITSNYFVLDLDAGDRITNIIHKFGVEI